MRVIGTLSASQVISTFRNDWALQKANVLWPEEGQVNRTELPLHRFAALSEVRHPFATFPILECAWSLADMALNEFMSDVYAHHPPEGGLPGSSRLRDFIVSFQRNPQLLGSESSGRITTLRKNIRSDDFVMTDFVIVTSEAARYYYTATPDKKYCLLDGHHRLLALNGENLLLDTIKVIVGEIPLRLGVAVINGKSREELKNE